MPLNSQNMSNVTQVALNDLGTERRTIYQSCEPKAGGIIYAIKQDEYTKFSGFFSACNYGIPRGLPPTGYVQLQYTALSSFTKKSNARKLNKLFGSFILKNRKTPTPKTCYSRCRRCPRALSWNNHSSVSYCPYRQ